MHPNFPALIFFIHFCASQVLLISAQSEPQESLCEQVWHCCVWSLHKPTELKQLAWTIFSMGFHEHWQTHAHSMLSCTISWCLKWAEIDIRGFTSAYVHAYIMYNISQIYKIIVVCLSVRQSVTEGQWKPFDLETQDTVSLTANCCRLELGDFCACQSLHYSYRHKH